MMRLLIVVICGLVLYLAIAIVAHGAEPFASCESQLKVAVDYKAMAERDLAILLDANRKLEARIKELEKPAP